MKFGEHLGLVALFHMAADKWYMQFSDVSSEMRPSQITKRIRKEEEMIERIIEGEL